MYWYMYMFMYMLMYMYVSYVQAQCSCRSAASCQSSSSAVTVASRSALMTQLSSLPCSRVDAQTPSAANSRCLRWVLSDVNLIAVNRLNLLVLMSGAFDPDSTMNFVLSIKSY